MKNTGDFGIERVVQPKGFIPFAAWKLDNSNEIRKNEMRIKLKFIKFEEGNFRQLCNICTYDEEKIKARVMDIVDKRGKLHNAFTDSGGICCGLIDEIGIDFKKNRNEQIEKGDLIISLTSLTSFPICIEKIGRINFNYGQVEVEGYGILFETSPFFPTPKDINLQCAMYAFDEAGSVAKACHIAKSGKKFLLLGTSLLSLLIYSAAIRESVGKQVRIVAVLDEGSMDAIAEKDLHRVLDDYVDCIYVADIMASMQSFELIKRNELNEDDALFDVSIICANLLGVEAISVLLTKEKGTLFFTNLINNYNMVLLFAESLGKHINTISLEEYTSDFTKYTLELMRKLKKPLELIDAIYSKNNLVSKLPTERSALVQYQEAGHLEDYIFASEKTGKMLEEVINIARYDCNVIIQGETGVGKEKVLELLHKNSKRNSKALVKINCATISENLAESEFFGYESGAFTGAKNTGKKGYFEMANNGILFFDEAGELPLSLQSKLLRVLQENQFYRVGGEKPVQVNVRVICASNTNLRQLVREGKFREDLYYRLNICEINIPPLRERKEDILCLGEYFLSKYNEKYMQSKSFDQEAKTQMEEYSWPGNVRELENTIHRGVVNSKENILSSQDVFIALEGDMYGGEIEKYNIVDENQRNGKETFLEVISGREKNLSVIMANHEKVLIEETLNREGTTRRAAKALGISQSQLMRKKSKYGL